MNEFEDALKGGGCCIVMVWGWLLFCGIAWLCRVPINTYLNALDIGAWWALLPPLALVLLAIAACWTDKAAR